MSNLVRFHTPEMGQVGHTRWFQEGEKLPPLDWSQVTAVETSEQMTVDQFRAKYPDYRIPRRPPLPTGLAKVEAGKFYKSRDGRVVGPMVWDDVSDLWRNGPDFVRNSGDYWHPNGSRLGHVEDDYDLVSEQER